MNRSKSMAPILLAVIVLMLPALYVISYTEPGKCIMRAHFDGTIIRTETIPCDYRIESEWAARIYYPLEQLDRWAFPQRWQFAWKHENIVEPYRASDGQDASTNSAASDSSAN